MLTRIVLALAAASLALASSPLQSQDKQQDPLGFDLVAKTPSFKARRPILVLNGTCALSDGIILKVNLSKAGEAVSGSEIVPQYIGAGNGTAELTGKKFVYDTAIDGPGKFVAQVALVEELQERHL